MVSEESLMSRRMSSKGRLNRLRDEAEAGEKEKKAAAPVAGGAMRVVWAVCDIGGKTVKQFPYPQKEAAEAEARGLTAATGQTHFVKRDKVSF